MSKARCAALLALAILSRLHDSTVAAEAARPNVLLIMTDDQGWGDFGFHGNPHLKTPHLDRLAGQSIELTQFYVSPVCSPTRASLMTGRYNYRTGAIDTYLGRSTMAADETTLAEMFAAAGYRTGIFGKWHLGDNYPSRADRPRVSPSRWCIAAAASASRPTRRATVISIPSLLHNGREVKIARVLQRHIHRRRDSTSSSRAAGEAVLRLPGLQLPAHSAANSRTNTISRYKRLGLDDETAKAYGMIANIDDNLGRLFATARMN